MAVVTGASRGAGRGIAVELGAAGATVYVTGRSTREQPATTYARILALSKLSRMPGSIEDTAEEVTREGGRGIPVRCDHADAADVERLFARVQRDEGRLDLLVNNAWGGHEAFTGVFDAPFWEQPLDQWEAMMDRGVRNHLLASRAAVPSMLQRRAGLVVTTTFWDWDRYIRGNLVYDLAKSAMNRLAFGMAEELRPHGIASVAVSPGWMRTELDSSSGTGPTRRTGASGPRWRGPSRRATWAGRWWRSPRTRASWSGPARCFASRISRRSTASPTWTVDGWRRSSSERADPLPGKRSSGPLHPAVHQLLQQLRPAQAGTAQLPVHRGDERCRQADREYRLLTVAARPDGSGGGAATE